MERWSATENVTGALERSETKGWSATVLELRKTSWSAEKLNKIGWSAGALILNCLERWSSIQKIVGAWSKGIYWSAGALKEKEVELWCATKNGPHNQLDDQCHNFSFKGHIKLSLHALREVGKKLEIPSFYAQSIGIGKFITPAPHRPPHPR